MTRKYSIVEQYICFKIQNMRNLLFTYPFPLKNASCATQTSLISNARCVSICRVIYIIFFIWLMSIGKHYWGMFFRWINILCSSKNNCNNVFDLMFETFCIPCSVNILLYYKILLMVGISCYFFKM